MRRSVFQFITVGSLLFSSLHAWQVWTEATPMAPWAARHCFATTVYDGKLWVLGGEAEGLFNDVWCSTNGVGWVRVDPAAQWSPRFRMTTEVFDGKLWIMGGGGLGMFNDVWCTADGDSWTEVTPAAGWAPRKAHCTVVFDNKLWVFGGNAGVVVNDVWCSSDGDSWELVNPAAPWQPRGGAASVVWRDTIWLMGGVNSISGYHYLNDVWFSADGVNWTLATDSAGWAPRRGLSAFVLRDTLWLLAGNAGIPIYNDVWYTVNGRDWLVATPAAEWAPRWNQGAAAFLDKLWVLGGWGNGGEIFRDVWFSEGLNGIEEPGPGPARSPPSLMLSSNPFRGVVTLACRLPSPAGARWTIRSRAGARVRSWIDRRPAADRSDFCWDGRDDAGRLAPAGVYFVSLESKGFSAIAKVAKLD
jgi:hypothetical protein